MDKPICYCFGIGTNWLRALIRRHDLRTVEDVQRRCRATRGCGGCRPEVEALLAEHAAERDDTAATPPAPDEARPPED